MEDFAQTLTEGLQIEVALREDDIIKTTTYLSMGVFIAVLIAVFIANKLS